MSSEVEIRHAGDRALLLIPADLGQLDTLRRLLLTDPPAGVVMEVVDAKDPGSRSELTSWLSNDYVPARVTEAASPVTSAMIFTPYRPTARVPRPIHELADAIGADGRRVTILWFLDVDPRQCWSYFTRECERIAAASVELVAPFVPSRMGTNRYEDELRDRT